MATHNDWLIFPNDVLDAILYSAFSPTKHSWAKALKDRANLSGIDRRSRALVARQINFWDTLTIWRVTPLDSIKAWLEKTTACDLTLRIHAEECQSWCQRKAKEEGRNLVHIASVQEFHTVVLPTLQHALGRVRDLHVSSNTHFDALGTVHALARFGIPQVVQMKVANRKHRAESGNPISLPPMPHLTTLVLEGMEPLCLGAPMFASLTKLRLGRIHEAPLRSDPTHVLDALAAALHLEVLQLDDVFDGVVRTGHRVLMPALTDFWLVFGDAESLSLGAALEIPRLSRFRVEMYGPDTTVGRLVDACAHLFAKAKRMEVWIPYGSVAEFHQLCTVTQSAVVLDLRYSVVEAGTAMLDLLPHLPFARLTHLRLSTHVPDNVLRAILEAAEHFCLTTGQVHPTTVPNRRWFFAAAGLAYEDFVEDVLEDIACSRARSADTPTNAERAACRRSERIATSTVGGEGLVRVPSAVELTFTSVLELAGRGSELARFRVDLGSTGEKNAPHKGAGASTLRNGLVRVSAGNQPLFSPGKAKWLARPTEAAGNRLRRLPDEIHRKRYKTTPLAARESHPNRFTLTRASKLVRSPCRAELPQ
ncbi:hypothetical protein C8R43DRAFT_1134091 [Mycena crocata]|nr:hypothetical protein C8R43DRAFT_1134091 [Mycena crocata]